MYNFKKCKDNIELILSEENNLNECDLSIIIAQLKVFADDMKILHRNLVSGNWFGDHEQIGEYYKKLEDIEDEATELLISLGAKDISIEQASKMQPSIEVREYLANEAFGIIKMEFETLMNAFLMFESCVPKDVYSKFEEYINYLRLESQYKIVNKLK